MRQELHTTGIRLKVRFEVPYRMQYEVHINNSFLALIFDWRLHMNPRLLNSIVIHKQLKTGFIF